MTRHFEYDSIVNFQNLDVQGFDCGVKQLNSFAKNQLQARHINLKHKAYVSVKDNKLVGYVTFVTKEITPNDRHFQYTAVPVLMLEQLAVDSRFSGLGIGKNLTCHVFRIALEVSELVSLNGVALWAVSSAKSFYEGLGFIELQNDVEREFTLMFLSIDAIRDAFSH